MTENTLEAGVWSTTALAFALTKSVYSFGPGGRFRVFMLELATQSESMSWTLVSKVIVCWVFWGVIDPENLNVTLVSAMLSFSAGPATITVSREKEGGEGVGLFWSIEGEGEGEGDFFSSFFSWVSETESQTFFKISSPVEKSTIPKMIKRGIRAAIMT